MQEPSHPSLSALRRASLIARIGTGLILIAIFLGTHTPPKVSPAIGSYDKLIHIAAYAVLAISLLASWELSIGILRPAHYFAVWLFGTLYGAFDELTQIPVGRTCDGSDWLADIAGVILGLTIFRLARPLLYRLI